MNRWPYRSLHIATFVVLLLATITGCKKSADTTAPAPAASSVVVRIENDGVHITTKTAEFLLTSTGALIGRLGGVNSSAPLAEPTDGIEITVAKAAVSDVVRDIAHAQVQDANGKLGATGKRVEIKGRSASTESTSGSCT